MGATAGSLAFASGPASAQMGDPAGRNGANGCRTAADITYRETTRPDEVPDDFTAPDGTDLAFYEISALDGFRVQSALLEPQRTERADTTLVLAVHGSGGSYYTSAPRILSLRLPERGYAVLGINTRQSRDAVNTDNFLHTRRDLEAAVATAKALGFERIVLAGHSLGNIQVQFYAATAWDPSIEGVILLAPFANLPWKTRTILVQDEENYQRLFEEAMAHLADGTLDQVMDTQMGWIRGQTVPLTAQHFLTYRWEHTSTAVGTYWIERIPYPILMLRDENDRVIRDFEPYDLLADATSPGAIVPDAEYVLLPNDTDSGGHGFSATRGPMTDAVADWLADHVQ